MIRERSGEFSPGLTYPVPELKHPMPTKEQTGTRKTANNWPRTNALRLARRKFHRLKVIEETEERASNGAIIWRCVCKCGNEVLVATHNLTTHNTQSCGCWQVDRSKQVLTKRGP